MSGGETPATERVRLWDPALRAFHWALAALVTASWALGQFGPDVMTLHFWSGYAILGLLGFRLVWGVVGPAPARFATFLRGPRAVAAYLTEAGARRPSHWRGHNPLGGWAVAALLLVLAAQAGTGLIADPDDFVNVGPLAAMVPGWARSLAVSVHHRLGALILALVLLHLAAILYYRFWKREDLVRPMIDGWKEVRRG